MTLSEAIGKIRKVLRIPLPRLIEKIWIWGLAHSPLAPGLERILGAQRHEQLIRCLSIRYWPNITSPKSFNENILYRKLFTDKKLFYRVSDKVKVRNYVRKKVGDKVLNEVFEITNKPKSFCFGDLPSEFVVKSSHGSGQIIIVKEKKGVNKKEIQNKCEKWLSVNPAKEKREYWYRKKGAQIIFEKILKGKKQEIPRDYKFFVFDGIVRTIEVDFNRFEGHTRTLYTREWKSLDCSYKFPRGPEVDRPPRLHEMINIAETLGCEFDFVRVDLFDTRDDGIVFGEMTLAPETGGGRFEPKSYDFKIGSYWKR